MPELAEVEYYRKQWLPAIGQTVIGVNLNRHKRVFRGVNCTSLSDDLIHQKFSDSAMSEGAAFCSQRRLRSHLEPLQCDRMRAGW